MACGTRSRVDIPYQHVNTVNSATDQDIGGFVVRLINVVTGETFSYTILIAPEDGPIGTFTGTAQAVFNNVPPGDYMFFVGESNSGDAEALIVSLNNVVATETLCLARGTRIRTPTGEQPIETLREGDLIQTVDHGPQPIRWIGISTHDRETLRRNPRLCPVRIPAHSLPGGLPLRDLWASRQHRFLLSSEFVGAATEDEDVLVSAIKLTGLDEGPYVDTTCEEPIEYYHLLCDRHELIYAEGAVTETLFVGEVTRAILDRWKIPDIDTLREKCLRPPPEMQAARLIPDNKVQKEVVAFLNRRTGPRAISQPGPDRRTA